jgi:hypothetical protein
MMTEAPRSPFANGGPQLSRRGFLGSAAAFAVAGGAVVRMLHPRRRGSGPDRR